MSYGSGEYTRVVTSSGTGGFYTPQGYVADVSIHNPTTTTIPTTYGQSLDPSWGQSATMAVVNDAELESLLEMLEVEPLDTTQFHSSLILSLNGKKYSLVDILHAQMQFMFRMNILLVHRQLGSHAKD